MARFPGGTPESKNVIYWGLTFGTLLDLVMLLSVSLWLAGLIFRELLDIGSAIVAIMGLALCAVVGRVLHSGLVRLTFRAALPIANVATFLLLVSPASLPSVLSMLLTLFVVAAGFYVMARGLFR